MEAKMEKVLNTVLKRVTPERKERMRIEALAEELEKKVASASQHYGVEARVRVEGSVAKDTWLSREPDIDVFMRVPTTIPRKSLGETCLRIARKATKGAEQIERFAEHPYLEAIVKGVRVNIVPCYDVKGREWLSATDRTPHHTDYVRKRLDEHTRGEVRLLKKFMKGIGAYGAEIKVGGFSGYLCELLTLHFKSFTKTLKAFAQHRQPTIIDIENHYRGREDELGLLFREPLVIIDPVDRGRNVASAVQPNRLYTFVAAARAFEKEPNLTFFYPRETTALTIRELEQKLGKNTSAILFLTFDKPDAVPDVLWGQLYKSQRSLQKLLQLNDFNVLRSLPWSDEKKLAMFVFELENRILPPIKKHLGPPLEKEHECGKFLAKHLSNSPTVSGPFIEDGRWVVELRRKHIDAVALLEERIRDGGRNAGVAEQISHGLRERHKIFSDEEIVGIYKKNGEFAKFLTEFLHGRPKWLEATRS